MRIISLNVARPRLAIYKGETINTGIFKQPVAGPVALRRRNLDGDRQADLSVHGGPFKAVYGYPSEHYAFWREELNDAGLPWGMFGENFTTEGLAEDALRIGDQFEIGSAVVMVRQPRVPCYKLAAKFQRDDIIERFLLSGRSGFYFRRRFLFFGHPVASDLPVIIIVALTTKPSGPIRRHALWASHVRATGASVHSR